MPPSSTVYLGIDPGQAGGLAALTANGVCRHIDSMPDTEKDVWDWLLNVRPIRGIRTTVAVIEKVHAMPKQGVSSTFKFGMGYGGLRMALIARGIRFEEIRPAQWMKEFGIPRKGKNEPKSAHKNRLKAKAQQLFPAVNVTLKTADALLLAEYCRRKNGKR